jgi:hypothetical protein
MSLLTALSLLNRFWLTHHNALTPTPIPNHHLQHVRQTALLLIRSITQRRFDLWLDPKRHCGDLGHGHVLIHSTILHYAVNIAQNTPEH